MQKKIGLFIIMIILLSTASLARDKAMFKQRRSYDGAPPIIPHVGHVGVKKLSCLSCHKHGGYVPKFSSFAPITPHPEWANCVQCHVPQKTMTVFKENQFIKWQNAKKIPKKSLNSSPPVIPHKSYQSQNCLSCHANNKASVKPTTHPERLNCIQCHVYQTFKETRTLEVKK